MVLVRHAQAIVVLPFCVSLMIHVQITQAVQVLACLRNVEPHGAA